MCKYSTEIPHPFPCSRCMEKFKLSSVDMAQFFTKRCKVMILQFAIIKPLCSALLVIQYIFYNEDTRKKEIMILLKVIVSISISLALYYMIRFYYCLR